MNKGKILIVFLFLIFFLVNVTGFNVYIGTPAGEFLNYQLGDFITTFRSIIIQAFPFLLLGIIISGLVSIDFFTSVLKFFETKLRFKVNISSSILKNRFFRYIRISLLGFLVPVCECGNVPVARRFMLKGMRPSETITFLLAAPIINPITIISTIEAFGGNSLILISRVLGGFIIANIIGMLFGLLKNEEILLTKTFYHDVCNHNHNGQRNFGKFYEFLKTVSEEFISILPVLLIGAFIASASQIFLPREVILSIGQNAVLSIVAMLAFAFIISICSSTDAFVAIAYSRTFVPGAIVAFLTFGPMIDIKILTLLKSSFKGWVLILMTLLAFLGSFLLGLIINSFL